MEDEGIREALAYGEIRLQANDAGSESFLDVPDREDEGKSRRDARPIVRTEKLIPIIDLNVTEIVHAVLVEPEVGNRHAQLMILSTEGPFLGERQHAFIVGFLKKHPVENVLHDPMLLIVCFFHEEGIVLDSVNEFVRLRLCAEESERREDEKEE